jgi:hypothetical protein
MHEDDGYSWYHFIIPVIMMSLFIFFIDFYIESYVTQKTDVAFASKYSALFAFTCSLALSFIWNHPHVVKVTVMDRIRTVSELDLSLRSILLHLYCIINTNRWSKRSTRCRGAF